MRDGKLVVRLKGVETQLVATSELKISGHHNVINALCAATAALAVGAIPRHLPWFGIVPAAGAPR